MRTSRPSRWLALTASAALLGSLLTMAVAAPATAAKPRCDGKVATIVGTDRSETIRGTKKADVIVAKAGKDIVYGRGGKDTICGGGGADTLYGGDGGDILKGGNGVDALHGGAGSDTLNGGAGEDDCERGPGFDRLFSCNEPATTGPLSITADTTLAAPHKGKISIDADNVTIDCAGHTLTGPGSGGFSAGIDVFRRQGVTIINCHPTDFSHGILVKESSGVTVRRSSANGNTEHGIAVEGGSDATTLIANVANRNGKFGVFLPQATDARLVDNVVEHNKEIGFALNRTRGSWFESNRVRWNRLANFDLYDQCEDNTFRNNRTKGGDQGIHVGVSAEGNLLQGNTAADHRNTAFNVYEAVGNTLRGNTAKNSGIGFTDGTSGSGTKGTGNTYANNRCVGNDVASYPRGLCR